MKKKPPIAHTTLTAKRKRFIGKVKEGRHELSKAQPKPFESKPAAPSPLGSGEVDNPKSALPGTVRIVVVDDHPLFRHGLVQLLNSDESFAVCGEASSAPEAMTIVRKLKPNLVIAD